MVEREQKDDEVGVKKESVTTRGEYMLIHMIKLKDKWLTQL